MTTLRDAAQQALEALEKEPADYADWIRTMKAARAALRTALAEQPAEQEPQTEDVAADAYSHACDEMVRWQRKRRLAGKEAGTTGSLCDGIAWLYLHIDTLERTAMAEQPAEQEPVAWKHDCAALLTNDVELWIGACPHCGKPRPAPQPAKRGPLTDAEIGQVRWQCRWNRMSTDDNVVYATTQQLDAFARAIEARLREKNGGEV